MFDLGSVGEIILNIFCLIISLICLIIVGGFFIMIGIAFVKSIRENAQIMCLLKEVLEYDQY